VWAAAQYGLAAVLWPVALALVWVRIGMVGLWPQRLLPTTFIMVAPPSVLALSGHALGVPSMAVHMLAGVALFFSLLSFTVIRRCLQQPFGMPFWALSFPLAASAALGLHLSPEPGLAQWLASLWLGVVTGVIGALLLATLRGLMQGQLLQPERPATLPKAGAEPSQPAGR
jgi:tellurite resistance protein